MRLPVRFYLFSAVLALGLLCRPISHAQSQVQPSVQATASQTTGNGTYIAIDPLANVRYDNKYDVSLGLAYDHMKAGPNLLQGSNLGGLDLVGLVLVQQALGGGRQRPRLSGHERRGAELIQESNGATQSIQGPFVAQYSLWAGRSGWDRTTSMVP